MPSILRALPYFTEVTSIVGPSVQEQALPYQIIIWISITTVDQFDLAPVSPRFPAILDTGLNDTFAIKPVHLRTWAGLRWDLLPEEGKDRFYNNIPVPKRRACVWLHPNQYGQRDFIDPLRRAVKIELPYGITVYGDGEQVGKDPRTKNLAGPRLPLIGLRALTENKCRLQIDCDSRLVFLDLPD
jgi:hypothetical protein